LVGVAIKFTVVPWQIVVPVLVVIDTPGVKAVLTVIVTWLVAVAVDTQFALLVIVTENWSPLLIADVV
jgi:hypothetical protein